MARTLKFAVLAAALMLSASVVGASAYSSATVDRTANIQVVGDSNGVIGLTPGGVDGVSNTGGKLSIDLTNLNNKATFDYGSLGSDTTFDTGDSEAFSITNDAGVQKTLTADYSLTNDDGNSVNNLVFTVYDDSGAKVDQFTEESSGLDLTMGSGVTYHVIISVDTPNSASDLSGTLSISA
ncbi:hypothetical protein [Halomarina rubra]|uniref:Uncharacterized protein n=1 Tax=Halomarina rubra TaxID=2071873 RepID=A0ABD6B272_9EURY|nr:hypothetical protein [Halomarina rubra]